MQKYQLFLTGTAYVRAALAYNNAFNECLAAGAGKAGSSEHTQLGTVVSPAARN